MSLSCTCYVDDPDWWGMVSDDFKPLATKRRRRCCSCKEIINVGAECLEMRRWRLPKSDIEENIYRDEVPLANHYYCAKCGEVFLNLEAYGYCMVLDEDVQVLLKEHWENTGFDPAKWAMA